MRLFLDAHVSGRRPGRDLRGQGHDVRAASEERVLDGWEDESLLALAGTDQRIMITFNAKDFARIAQRWAEARRQHSGLLLVVGLTPGDHGALVAGITRVLADRPEPESWTDYVAFVSRPPSMSRYRAPRRFP